MKQPQHVKNPIQPQWATEITNRRPKFKIHAKLGHAKNAISYRSPTHYWSKTLSIWMRQPTEPTVEEATAYAAEAYAADLYEWVDGEWVHHPELSFSMDGYVFDKVIPGGHGRLDLWVASFLPKGQDND